MPGERKRWKAGGHKGDTSGGADVSAEPRHLAQARRLQQARAAIEGNLDQRDDFEAAPDLFAARYGVDAVALAAQPADPAGNANALGGVVVAPSSLHGVGVHTTVPIGAGEKVCDVEVGGKMSYTLAKVNRSDQPNATFVDRGGKMDVVTLGTVSPGQELTIDYPTDDQVPADATARGGGYDPS